MQPGFAFLLNRLCYTGSLPCQVIKGVEFNKATDAQRRVILEVIREGHLRPLGDLWYYTAKPRPLGSAGSYTFEHVAIEDAEFWVLNFNDPHSVLQHDLPLRLIEPELELGPVVYGGGRNLNAPNTFHFFQANLQPVYEELAEEALHTVGELYRLIMAARGAATDPANTSILGILENFNSSRAYVRTGHMALLSHFTIIEGLLTHQPNPTAGDSLNHQLSTKIPLLLRRMRNPVDHVPIFGAMDLGKLWKEIYDVRSAFAHGNHSDLPKKFSRLKGFGEIERYVYSTMKALLRLALAEPQLVYDLRRC